MTGRPGRKTSSGSKASSEVAPRTVEWSRPPPELSLPDDAIHVWRAGLDLEAVRLCRLELKLSADERKRAARFRFARDRELFIAARGLLREILALYLDTAAQRLRFRYGAHGKPFLSEAEHSDLRFNVAHSLDTVLVAVAHEREVGVDIERTRDNLAVEDIAGTVLCAPEKRALSRLGCKAKRMAFLRFWTRKEAFIKADGRGVSLPLEQIDVSIPMNRVAVLDQATGKWRASSDWTLHTLAIGPDHAAALAAAGQDWHLACWQWPG